MKQDKFKVDNGGNAFPLLPVLGVAFVVLKLTEVIDWSWWWVLAPLWGPLALGLCLLPFYAAYVWHQDSISEPKVSRLRGPAFATNPYNN